MYLTELLKLNLILRRILAFCMDYVLIVFYGLLLFSITTVFEIGELSTIQAQLLGFFSLTVPVFLYFYLTESGKKKSTLGKRILKIKVIKNSERSSIFIRNLFKFLPWEIAHVGVHWMFYYSSQNTEVPVWVWLLLILPQVTVVVYFISIIYSKGRSSVYDKFGNTSIKYFISQNQ